MTSTSKDKAIQGSVLMPLIAVAILFGLAGCGTNEPKANLRQSPPREWYEARHGNSLRDFYGYQVRRQQHLRHEAELQEIKVEQWRIGENRRVTARERVVGQNKVSEFNFFELQNRQQDARNSRKIENLEGRKSFVEAFARNRVKIDREADKRQMARLETLRIESERRKFQVGLLQISRRNAARIANIPLAQVRGLSTDLQQPRQIIKAESVVAAGTVPPVAVEDQAAPGAAAPQ